jgi:proteasome lid subunit RPN8/RPN11
MAAALWLPVPVRRAIVAHARREAPRECCGLLVGRGRRVAFAVAMPNLEGGTTRYRIDDRAHIDLRRTIRTFTPPLEILGVYHSHPAGDPIPSETDVAQAFYADWIHVIVGLGRATAACRAYRIAHGRVRAVPLAAPRTKR